MIVNDLQLKAYALAVKALNQNSKWFADDCYELAALYKSKTDEQCRISIARLSHVPTQEEINRNCQF
jgi:hypothetical protein